MALITLYKVYHHHVELPQGILGKQKLEISEANLLKKCLDLYKWCHPTDLLKTLNVRKVLLIYLHRTWLTSEEGFSMCFPRTVFI